MNYFYSRSWQKRKTHSWKSLFSRNPRQSNSNHDIKGLHHQTAAAKISPSEVHISLHGGETNKTEMEKENKTPNFNVMQSISQGKLSKESGGYDGKSITTMDVCVRSNSIDSLRTAGHSRSVSHDSYFDLLQSPLRVPGMDNSREMSELGLNFDREEPEMRIFSESESLVSSPKVIRDDKIAPTRKVMTRARPEEYSSTANSVNPSPKKQPRLNLQSPHDIGVIWMNGREDESSCKRYKLEDQLSDIQFIDCNTPEHTIASNAHANTIFTSVQVHDPPVSSAGSSHEVLKTPVNERKIIGTVTTRYSYPGNRGYDTMKTSTPNKESRFSYPGGRISEENSSFKDHHPPVTIKPTQNRYSLYDTTNTTQPIEAKNNILVLRSNSVDVFNSKTISTGNVNRSKLSVVTPQSPLQSPRYSLLVGETSSEASSSLNTPTYDHSRNSFDNTNNTKDFDKIKKDMSLDLTQTTHSSGGHKKTLSTPNTPNHTHTSDNTSQSMTPSEFGYHNLNRIQSPAASSENSPKDSITHENLEQNYYENSHLKNPIKSTINIIYKSPTKTTNNIIDEHVYEDVVTPISEITNSCVEHPKSLLETTFDDKMVYEQVKFYKTTISEINEMLDNGNDDNDDNSKKVFDDSLTMESDSVVPNPTPNTEDINKSEDLIRPTEIDMSTTADSYTEDKTFNEDIAMSSDHDLDVQDSLEFDQNVSMYENVHIKQPPKVYENVEMNVKKQKLTKQKSNLEKPTLELKPSNFIVRQLATKFEISPSENSAPFDFSKQLRKSDLNRNSPCTIRARNNATRDMNKQIKITRSLDENAFIREFGSKRLENLNQSQQTIQQFSDLDNTLSENRRKSLEFTRPKSLNSPKKLPSLVTPDELCKSSSSPLKLDLQKSPQHHESNSSQPVKITPTTENRISLIQNNVHHIQQTLSTPPPPSSQPNSIQQSDDEKSLCSLVSAHKSTSSLIENCKLDRDRIEKIKEERRHQLSEKFRNESFRETSKPLMNIYQPIKSKSKTDVSDIKDSTFSNHQCQPDDKFKSKSRNDVRTAADNFINQESCVSTGYSTTGNMALTTINRVRRISDEKNQNDVSLISENDKMKKKLEKRNSGAGDFGIRERDLNAMGIGTIVAIAVGETESSNTPIKCSQISS